MLKPRANKAAHTTSSSASSIALDAVHEAYRNAEPEIQANTRRLIQAALAGKPLEPAVTDETKHAQTKPSAEAVGLASMLRSNYIEAVRRSEEEIRATTSKLIAEHFNKG